MKGDYLRYIYEISEGEEAKTLNKRARESYEEANEYIMKNLDPLDPIRLGLALSVVVQNYEIYNMREEACAMGKQIFDQALQKLEDIPQDKYIEVCNLLQILRDNLTLWTTDNNTDEL